MGDTRRVIHTPHAPAAIGPYSQAVEAAGVLYCSGQIPLDPRTGEIVGPSVTEQTMQVLSNLQHVLQEAGYTLRDVARCCVYLKDMDDFADVNAAYAGFFYDDPPSRVTVEVSRLPKDVLVEISCIAVKSE